MTIFNEPEFQALVRRAKLLRVWNVARCLYSWVMVLGPVFALEWAAAHLSRALLWVYVISMLVLFVWGIIVWCKAIGVLMAPAHKAVVRFNTHPSEQNLRLLCAQLVSVKPEKRHPKNDYDLFRRAHTIAERSRDIIPRELFDFYTQILRACHVAAV